MGEELHLASTLCEALEAIEPDEISIDPDRLVYYLAKDLKTRLPFGTIFENVYRLPPGVYFQGDGSEWHMESNLVPEGTPASFDDACHEISDALRGEDVVVCLSGGADSAALAGMLHARDVEFDTVVFDWGPGDSDAVERGPIIADQLGVDYDVVEIQRPLTANEAPNIEQCLREDIVKPYPPTMQVADNYPDNALFAYGFYPDVLCWPKMRDQHSYQSMAGESLKRIVGKWLRFLPNLQYTHHVIENEIVRKAYLGMTPDLMQIMNPVIEGALGQTFPEENYNLGKYNSDARYTFSAATEDVFRGHSRAGGQM
ncbi:hypothetical protein VB779_16635 [Haloarculaceae archaeon H-GB11]|nr:hypothetical protein [Haloarculaceae archaeon H-GB11]